MRRQRMEAPEDITAADDWKPPVDDAEPGR